jgi:hypothetical protein
MATLETGPEASAADDRQKEQGGVASGRSRGDKKHLSNTSPRSPKQSRAYPRSRVKGATGRASSTKVVKRGRVRLERRA